MNNSFRCAVYNNIPAGCTMVTDPDDSCCLIPQCVPTPATGSSTRSPSPGVSTPRPTQYHIPTAAPGQITGSANIPTPRPGSGQLTPSPLSKFFVCLFDLILYVPSTIFQLNRDGSSWVEPVLS